MRIYFQWSSRADVDTRFRGARQITGLKEWKTKIDDCKGIIHGHLAPQLGRMLLAKRSDHGSSDWV